MARTKEFDVDVALDAAIGIFRIHGYAGTSASMLTEGMGIGRQSLYDTFGDKWQLYCAAVERYGRGECEAHIQAVEQGTCAMDGLRAMLNRVVQTAHQPCLGVGSMSEFGNSYPELVKAREGNARRLRKAIIGKVEQARRQGEISSPADVQGAASFLIASIATIRLAARGGADNAALVSLADFSLRALH